MRPVRILVTSTERLPSVELGALIPLYEAQKKDACAVTYKNTDALSILDIAWCDILFIVRGISALTVEFARAAKNYERIILGYWDDDLTSVPLYSLAYKLFSDPEIQSNIKSLFCLTDKFFAPTVKLAERLSALHGHKAGLLPVMSPDDNFGIPFQNSRQKIIGYSGSVDHVSIVNRLCLPSVLRVLNSVPEVKCDIIGPPPEIKYSFSRNIRYRPYIRDYRRYLVLAASLNWYIGLAPQESDEFTTYKFYNKFMEYTYIGCAGIYTNVQPYSSVIQDGMTGLLCQNEVGAWTDAMQTLLHDSALGFRIRKNAHDFFKSRHNRQEQLSAFLEELKPYMSHRAPEISKSAFNTYPLLARGRVAIDMAYVRSRGFKNLCLDGVARMIHNPIIYPVYLRLSPLLDLIMHRKRRDQ